MNDGVKVVVHDNMGLQAVPTKRPLEEIEVFSNAKIQCTMKDRLYSCLEDTSSDRCSIKTAKRSEYGQSAYNYGQNIRCEENGKMYVQLGTMAPSQDYAVYGMNNRVRDSMSYQQRQHYRKQRLSVFNISMFKLKKYRQFSDPCLHRSVLVCNTLRRIEREMEREGVNVHCNESMAYNQTNGNYEQVAASNFYAPPPSPFPSNFANDMSDKNDDNDSTISWRTVLNMSNSSCLDSSTDFYSSELAEDSSSSSDGSPLDECLLGDLNDFQMDADDFSPNWRLPSNDVYFNSY